jgi:hypothetical protein
LRVADSDALRRAGEAILAADRRRRARMRNLGIPPITSPWLGAARPWHELGVAGALLEPRDSAEDVHSHITVVSSMVFGLGALIMKGGSVILGWRGDGNWPRAIRTDCAFAQQSCYQWRLLDSARRPRVRWPAEVLLHGGFETRVRLHRAAADPSWERRRDGGIPLGVRVSSDKSHFEVAQVLNRLSLVRPGPGACLSELSPP